MDVAEKEPSTVLSAAEVSDETVKEVLDTARDKSPHKDMDTKLQSGKSSMYIKVNDIEVQFSDSDDEAACGDKAHEKMEDKSNISDNTKVNDVTIQLSDSDDKAAAGYEADEEIEDKTEIPEELPTERMESDSKSHNGESQTNISEQEKTEPECEDMNGNAKASSSPLQSKDNEFVFGSYVRQNSKETEDSAMEVKTQPSSSMEPTEASVGVTNIDLKTDGEKDQNTKTCSAKEQTDTSDSDDKVAAGNEADENIEDKSEIPEELPTESMESDSKCHNGENQTNLSEQENTEPECEDMNGNAKASSSPLQSKDNEFVFGAYVRQNSKETEDLAMEVKTQTRPVIEQTEASVGVTDLEIKTDKEKDQNPSRLVTDNSINEQVRADKSEILETLPTEDNESESDSEDQNDENQNMLPEHNIGQDDDVGAKDDTEATYHDDEENRRIAPEIELDEDSDKETDSDEESDKKTPVKGNLVIIEDDIEETKIDPTSISYSELNQTDEEKCQSVPRIQLDDSEYQEETNSGVNGITCEDIQPEIRMEEKFVYSSESGMAVEEGESDDDFEERRAEAERELRFAEAQKKFTYFWKNKDVFSQWHMSEFTVNDITFTCAEQYMMYQKATLFGSDDIAKKVLETTDPRRMKALGRQVKKFSDRIWSWNCLDVVKAATMLKYSQNEEMKKQLFDTYPTVIVEASPYDKIWGIGFEEWQEEAWSDATWAGLNLLGFILTEVRDELLYKERHITKESKRNFTVDLFDILFLQNIERDPGTDVDYYYNMGGYFPDYS